MSKPKFPKTQAEFEAALKAARNDGFNSGTVAALGVITAHGDGVIWAEVVQAAGMREVVRHAKKNQGDWAWAGFKQFARAELGADVVRNALSKAKP